jgi:Fe-S-cluster-containing hydrogenase component 2
MSGFQLRREDAMANKPQKQQNTEKNSPISRRELLTMGVGAAGIVAGGVVGLASKARTTLPVQDNWLGRNIANCTGCRLCQVACSLIKEKKIQPGIARITVHQYYPGVEFPVACYQCGEGAKCVEACPVTALSFDSSKKLNTIMVDTTRCLRTTRDSECTECRDKCPGLAVTFHPTTREPLICDLCGGDPECVKLCPENTVTMKGVKMAAVAPEQIAAGLAMAYLPAKTVPVRPGGPGGPVGPPPAPAMRKGCVTTPGGFVACDAGQGESASPASPAGAPTAAAPRKSRSGGAGGGRGGPGGKPIEEPIG